MEVHLVKLEQLFEQLPDLDEQRFCQRYPGAFVVAVGFLTAEEDLLAKTPAPTASRGQGEDEAPLVIEPRKGRPDLTGGRRLDFTAAFKFGKQIRHDLVAEHPLAGYAFFLQPTPHGGGQVLIGRSATCAITVPDKSVSEMHCRIEVTAEAVVVTDLGSTNGTSINQQRIEQGQAAPLANEDILSLGRYSFQLLSSLSLYDYLREIASIEL